MMVKKALVVHFNATMLVHHQDANLLQLTLYEDQHYFYQY